MVLWRCLSHPHSLCEGHSHSQLRMFRPRQDFIGPQGWRCHHLSGPCTAIPFFWRSGSHLSHQRSLCCRSACWLLSFHWAPLRRFGSAFTVYLSHRGRGTWGSIGYFSSGLKKPISRGLSLHTTCSSLVAATGLKPVTICLTLGTLTGHSASRTALAVPGSREHSPDNDLRDSNFGMTQRKQLNLECCALQPQCLIIRQ